MRTLVISLDRTPERWTQFRANNKELSCSRRSAIDGTTLDASLLVKTNHIEAGLRYSPGALGCAASHIGIWQDVADSGKESLVLEDDAVVHRDWELLFYKVRETLPRGWEYLALGFNMDCPMQFDLLPGVTPCMGSFLAHRVAGGLKTFSSLDIRPVAYRLQLCFGTPGYVITPTGARKLLEKLLPLKNFTLKCAAGEATNTGIDVALNTVYQDAEAYVSFPPLVITPNDKSSSTVQVP